MSVETSVISELNGYVNRVARLLRLDAALLAIETKQKLQSVAVSLGLLAAAAMVASLGVIILLFAIVLLLVQLGLSPALAAFLVAFVLFAAAGVLVFLGVQRLKSWTLKPHRTLAQFQTNIEALRASLHQ
jgi:Putative Actinobacterial Holin-X, holin superfamily III